MKTFKLLWFEIWKMEGFTLPPEGRIFLWWNPELSTFYTIHVTNSLRVTLAIVLILVYFLVVNLEPTTPKL